MTDRYETFCPQCEEWIVIGEGEIVVGTDGTRAFQGDCPTCETLVTCMLSESRKD